MKHKSKPVNPVDFNSGERRDLAEIIKNLRNDIVVDKTKGKGAPEPNVTGEQPDNASVEKAMNLRGRPSRVEKFRMGLSGITARVPA
jgi:hypothetical protein